VWVDNSPHHGEAKSHIISLDLGKETVMENQVKKIPKAFIYEEYEGIPMYRKGYKDVTMGLKQIEELNMGTSTSQWFVISAILRHLFANLPVSKYLIGTNEVGLHLNEKSNLSADIAIYEKSESKLNFNSLKYAASPPKVVIEVDIKMDIPDSFQSEDDYLKKKTEKLLEFGVSKVIWVFTSSQRVLIADNIKRWSFNSWDIPFEVLDGVEVNVWELMLENGFQEY
jgi:hypothetical protein